MSWNLFKLRLNSKLDTFSGSPRAITHRLSTFGQGLDDLYSTHFDVATSGGTLQKNAAIGEVVRLNIAQQFFKNLKNVNLTYRQVSDQFKKQATNYWRGKLIQGPTGSTIVLSANAWLPFIVKPNSVKWGRKFTDSLTYSLYTQKMGLLGVTIQKAPPGMVTPWSGMFFQGFDTPLSVNKVLEPMEMNYNNFVDFMIELKGGKQSEAQELKELFQESLEKTFNPQIFEQMSKFPTQYGINFNNLQYPKSFDFSKFIK